MRRVGAGTREESWAVLVRPSANRVYAESSVDLLQAELAVLDRTQLGGRLRDVVSETIGGVPYVTFRLDPGDDASRVETIERLSVLSTLYALFDRRDDGALRPLALAPLARLDEDLLTIQKYAGKTNELFTRMLLNVTLWASDAGADLRAGAQRERPVRVLDPLCGRGTTLHQALVYGCEADGIDLDAGDFDAHAAFLKTWLRRKRLKHLADVTPIRREGRHEGRRLDVEVAADKEAWKDDRRLRLLVVQADTTRAREFFRPARYDALVADAPYGVQHGATSGGQLHRSPLDLLEAALPGWVELLRPGGALGLAWNLHVASREATLAVLGAAGLEVLDDGPWRGFRHRVDSSIDRDVIVARKPARPSSPREPAAST